MNTQLRHHVISEPVRVPPPAGHEKLIADDDFSVDADAGLAVLMLDDKGVIFDCSRAAERLLGCVAAKLTWKHISTVLPQLKEIGLVHGRMVNPHLRYLSHIGHGFEVVSMSGIHFIGAIFFNEIDNLGRRYLRIIIKPAAYGWL